MQFPDPLICGTLIQRYKRFLADVTLEDGTEVTAHCANTGAMTGVAAPGSEVWLSPARNPNRKLRYSWELIRVGDLTAVRRYADESSFDAKPIAMNWDERGRLWVIQSQDYPHGLDNDVGGDRITICEDTDGDGKADSFIDFATEQSLSTGITIVTGGAIVAQAPEMVFLEDTDGDDIADKKTLLFDGFGTFDTHAGPANLKYGHDNQIWGSVGYSAFEKEFAEYCSVRNC